MTIHLRFIFRQLGVPSRKSNNNKTTQKNLYICIYQWYYLSHGDHADDDRDKDSCVFVFVFFG